MAGPFGSTSDTTTVVSPLSGLGLSLPPDMAKPNPSLESCHYKRTTLKRGFLAACARKSDMNEDKERRRVSGWSVSMCRRSSEEIEGEGAHSISVRRENEERAGRVAMNSCWSVCCETDRSEARSGSTPASSFTTTSEKLLVSMPGGSAFGDPTPFDKI